MSTLSQFIVGDKLNNLDTTVSSRAPASTALSNAVWTDARAGKLDSVLLKTDPLVAAPKALIPSNPNDTVDTGYDFLARVAGLTSGSTTSTTYADIVNYTGQGVIEFCAVSSYEVAVSMQMIIDGVNVGSCSSDPTATNYNGKSLVGVYMVDSVGCCIALSQVPFYTSLVIQAKISSTGTATVYYKYRKTA